MSERSGSTETLISNMIAEVKEAIHGPGGYLPGGHVLLGELRSLLRTAREIDEAKKELAIFAEKYGRIRRPEGGVGR